MKKSYKWYEGTGGSGEQPKCSICGLSATNGDVHNCQTTNMHCGVFVPHCHPCPDIKEKPEQVCKWKPRDTKDYWVMSCGRKIDCKYCDIDYKFCPYCGKPITFDDKKGASDAVEKK